MPVVFVGAEGLGDAVSEADGFTLGVVSATSSVARSVPAQPISAIKAGTTSRAKSQPSPGRRRYNFESAMGSPVIGNQRVVA
jgi:hypothetical protein